MAILKHIASKSSNYGAALEYLIFKHDELRKTPILDQNGNRIMRDEFYLDGLNCEPYSFDAGQYLSTKEVQQQFAKAIFKKKFRAEHSKELDAYAESVKYFREENDGKLPSLKSLKKRKEKLTQEIAERKKAYAPLREESRRLEIASDNVYSIFRKTDEMKSDLAWKREWEAKVREKARQEQARQEKRERQPKRKKRSYDMSL